MKSIINGNVYQENHFKKGLVVVFSEKVEAVLDSQAYSAFKKVNEAIEEIDAEGLKVVPGFIDVHIHGYKGIDTMEGDMERLRTMSKAITENGITAYLPTTMTMPSQAIKKALETIDVLRLEKHMDGAMVLGAHMEGPYINETKKGAQSAEYIALPDQSFVEEHKEVIQVMTIAPEVCGAMEMIETYKDQIKFSIGHTSATYEQALEAYEKGAQSATHLFNAMTGIHHREPGVVGAVLACDCYAEVIADNFHLNRGIYSILVKTKGIDKLLLITDCMEAGGLKDGVYDLGGQPVLLSKGLCTLSEHPETIAGSVLKLNQGLRNVVEACQLPLEKLLPMVTMNQATYLGLEDIMGSLDQGKLANIVLIDDAFVVQTTIVKGKIVYENQV